MQHSLDLLNNGIDMFSLHRKSRNEQKTIIVKNTPKSSFKLERSIIKKLRNFIGVYVFLALIGPVLDFGINQNLRIGFSFSVEYWGTILAGLGSLFVVYFALYQGEKSLYLQKKLDSQERKQEIAPHLRIELKKLANNIFEVILNNDSPYRADYVYLFEDCFCRFVKNNERGVNRIIQFGISEDSCDHHVPLIVHDWVFSMSESGYPSVLNFTYSDIDGNMICQDFRLMPDNGYEASAIEYI